MPKNPFPAHLFSEGRDRHEAVIYIDTHIHNFVDRGWVVISKSRTGQLMMG